MSRGLGKWQRFIMDQLQDEEWHKVTNLYGISLKVFPMTEAQLQRNKELDEEGSWGYWLRGPYAAREEAIKRAARTLRKRGLVQRGIHCGSGILGPTWRRVYRRCSSCPTKYNT